MPNYRQPKITTGHLTGLQRKEIQFHTPEYIYKVPQPGNLYKPLVQTHSQRADSTIKRNHEIPACSKGT